MRAVRRPWKIVIPVIIVSLPLACGEQENRPAKEEAREQSQEGIEDLHGRVSRQRQRRIETPAMRDETIARFMFHDEYFRGSMSLQVFRFSEETRFGNDDYSLLRRYIDASEQYGIPVFDVYASLIRHRNRELGIPTDTADLQAFGIAHMVTVGFDYDEDGWKQYSERVNMGIPPPETDVEPIPGKRLVPEIHVQHFITADGAVMFRGRTNLPDDMTLMLMLCREGEETGAQTSIKVWDGVFESEPFVWSSRSVSYACGRYVVELTSPIASVQSTSVGRVMGAHGSNLYGRHVVSSPVWGKRIEYKYAFEIPSDSPGREPLASERSAEPSPIPGSGSHEMDTKVHQFVKDAFHQFDSNQDEDVLEVFVLGKASEEFGISVYEALLAYMRIENRSIGIDISEEDLAAVATARLEQIGFRQDGSLWIHEVVE